MEVWRKIPGFEQYEASSEGRVRSVDRVIECKNGVRKQLKGKILRPCYHSKSHPYPYVQLGAGTGRMFAVHRLVAWTFLGECPRDHQVRHLDGNPKNSSARNLAYGTCRENQADRLRHGTMIVGEQHPMSKLTEEDVKNIRARVERGEPHGTLAAEYGVTVSHISHIKRRKSWKHLRGAA